jgi:ABC-2 type transport system permease protein
MFKLLAIAWKDTLLRFSSRTELLFFLILPIVFIFMLGGGIGRGAGQGDTRLPILLVDPAPGSISAEIRSALDASQTVRYTPATLAEAEQALSDNDVVAALIIPADLEAEAPDRGLELRLASNNPNRLAVEQAVQAAITRVGQPLEVAQAVTDEAERRRGFADDAERTAFAGAVADQARRALADTPQRVVTVQASTPDSIVYDPAINQSAGQLITWVFIPLI